MYKAKARHPCGLTPRELFEKSFVGMIYNSLIINSILGSQSDKTPLHLYINSKAFYTNELAKEKKVYDSFKGLKDSRVLGYISSEEDQKRINKTDQKRINKYQIR